MCQARTGFKGVTERGMSTWPCAHFKGAHPGGVRRASQGIQSGGSIPLIELWGTLPQDSSSRLRRVTGEALGALRAALRVHYICKPRYAVAWSLQVLRATKA